MNYESRIKALKALLIFIVLVCIDQFIKYLIRFNGGFYICNSGISWGINLASGIFWFIWSVVILATLYFFLKTESVKHAWAFTLILTGAVSNIIDRLAFGCVVDFIDFKIWPVFNLADVFIAAGAVLLLVKWKKV